MYMTAKQYNQVRSRLENWASCDTPNGTAVNKQLRIMSQQQKLEKMCEKVSNFSKNKGLCVSRPLPFFAVLAWKDSW